MTPTIELRVLELACSRICHDLISPITAVNNGMELLGDNPVDLIDEIKDLLTHSAREASRRLQFFRVAFGLGGSEAAPIGLEEAGRLAQGLVDGGKTTLEWPNDVSREIGMPGMKILLNTTLMGVDALPRGGTVKVEVGSDTRLSLKVTAQGQGARIAEECRRALSSDTEIGALTARSVQAYLTYSLINTLGGSLEIGDGGSDEISLNAVLPG